jgi:hypothetical protein
MMLLAALLSGHRLDRAAKLSVIAPLRRADKMDKEISACHSTRMTRPAA